MNLVFGKFKTTRLMLALISSTLLINCAPKNFDETNTQLSTDSIDTTTDFKSSSTYEDDYKNYIIPYYGVLFNRIPTFSELSQLGQANGSKLVRQNYYRNKIIAQLSSSEKKNELINTYVNLLDHSNNPYRNRLVINNIVNFKVLVEEAFQVAFNVDRNSIAKSGTAPDTVFERLKTYIIEDDLNYQEPNTAQDYGKFLLFFVDRSAIQFFTGTSCTANCESIIEYKNNYRILSNILKILTADNTVQQRKFASSCSGAQQDPQKLQEIYQLVLGQLGHTVDKLSNNMQYEYINVDKSLKDKGINVFSKYVLDRVCFKK